MRTPFHLTVLAVVLLVVLTACNSAAAPTPTVPPSSHDYTCDGCHAWANGCADRPSTSFG